MGSESHRLSGVVEDLEAFPVDRRTTVRFDTSSLQQYIDGCWATLKDMEASITKATGRISTDPDYLNRRVQLSERECNAYGLTDEDMEIYLSRVRIGTVALQLHRKKLVEEMLRLGLTETDNDSGNVKSELQKQEREICILNQRLLRLEATLQHLKETKELARQPDLDRTTASGDSLHEVLQDTTLELDTEQRGRVRSKSHPKTQALGREAIRAKNTSRRRSQSTLWDWWRRKHTSRKGASRTTQQPSYNLNGTTPQHGTDDIHSVRRETQELPVLLDDSQSEFTIIQYHGFTLSHSRLNFTPHRSNPVVSRNEVLGLVAEQRKYSRKFSALTNFELLSNSTQKDIERSVQAMNPKYSDCNWAVQSIELKKPGHLFASRWRREESEIAQLRIDSKVEVPSSSKSKSNEPLVSPAPYPSPAQSRDKLPEIKDVLGPPAAGNNLYGRPLRNLEQNSAPLFKDYFPVERTRSTTQQQTLSRHSVDGDVVLRREQSVSSVDSVQFRG
ncbi:MAG: hypothetical protein Q9174_003652 [Haloplaca sp. 1 TL-2023]